MTPKTSAGRQITDRTEIVSLAGNGRKSSAPAYGDANQYETTISDWDILARPLRARESCLQCHSADGGRTKMIEGMFIPGELLTPQEATAYPKQKSVLKPGDLLGAAIYAYRRQRP